MKVGIKILTLTFLIVLNKRIQHPPISAELLNSL